MLGIDIERLEGIHLDKKSPEDCFLEVYRIGKMEFDQKFTWRRVLDILHVLKENRLRKEIQDSLVKEHSYVHLKSNCIIIILIVYGSVPHFSQCL